MSGALGNHVFGAQHIQQLQVIQRLQQQRAAMLAARAAAANANSQSTNNQNVDPQGVCTECAECAECAAAKLAELEGGKFFILTRQQTYLTFPLLPTNKLPSKLICNPIMSRSMMMMNLKIS